MIYIICIYRDLNNLIQFFEVQISFFNDVLQCGLWKHGTPNPPLTLRDPIHLWIFLLLTGPNSPFPTELIFYVPHSARNLEIGRAELVC